MSLCQYLSNLSQGNFDFCVPRMMTGPDIENVVSEHGVNEWVSDPGTLDKPCYLSGPVFLQLEIEADWYTWSIRFYPTLWLTTCTRTACFQGPEVHVPILALPATTELAPYQALEIQLKPTTQPVLNEHVAGKALCWIGMVPVKCLAVLTLGGVYPLARKRR